MPLTDVDHRARALGRIRAGEYDEAASRPTSIDTWRLTSPHRDLLDAAAVLWGGTVEDLTRKDTDDRYQLATAVAELDVVVPPQDVAAGQWYELYTRAGLRRRCDGTLIVAGSDMGEHFSDQAPPPCLCNPADRECRPTTHLAVILPDLPDVGIWRLTTRSMYAAIEIPSQVAILQTAGDYPPAVLALEARTVRRGGETHRFTVPIVRTRATLTSLLAGTQQPLLTAGEDPSGEAPAAPAIAPRSPTGPGAAPDTAQDAADRPEPPTPPPTPERPRDRNLSALAALVAEHPYTGRNAAELIAWITDLYTAGAAAGVEAWAGESIDDLADKHMRTFREPGTLDDVDIGFTRARAEAASIEDLRTFATRLWMDARTHVDRKTRTAI